MSIIGGSLCWFGSKSWQKSLDSKQTSERYRSCWKTAKSWNFERKNTWIKDIRLARNFQKIDILSSRNATNLPLNSDGFWAFKNKETEIDAKTQSRGFFQRQKVVGYRSYWQFKRLIEKLAPKKHSEISSTQLDDPWSLTKREGTLEGQK